MVRLRIRTSHPSVDVASHRWSTNREDVVHLVVPITPIHDGITPTHVEQVTIHLAVRQHDLERRGVAHGERQHAKFREWVRDRVGGIGEEPTTIEEKEIRRTTNHRTRVGGDSGSCLLRSVRPSGSIRSIVRGAMHQHPHPRQATLHRRGSSALQDIGRNNEVVPIICRSSSGFLPPLTTTSFSNRSVGDESPRTRSSSSSSTSKKSTNQSPSVSQPMGQYPAMIVVHIQPPTRTRVHPHR